MPTTSSKKYTCSYCNLVKHSKDAHDRHIITCRYLNSTQKERDMQITTLPSQQVMFQMLLDLSVKYEDLHKKMDRIQTNQTNQTRKSILEYLNNQEVLNTRFSKWIHKIAINKEHLKLFFDDNVVDSLKKAIADSFVTASATSATATSATATSAELAAEHLPLRNFIQKPGQVYIYEDVPNNPNIFEWRTMQPNDWQLLYKVLSKKLKNMYFQWQKENKDDENDDSMFEYLKKIDDIEKNVDAKIRKIKEFIIKRIQTTLVIVE